MNKSSKSLLKYKCIRCDYYTSNIKDYNKHLTTRKHSNRTSLNDIEPKNPKNPHPEFICECGKEYSARNSLWYHKKKCYMNQVGKSTNIIIRESTQQEKTDMTQKLVELIMSKNQEFMT